MASTQSPKTLATTWKLPVIEARQTAPAVDSEVVLVFQGENKKISVPARSKYSSLLEKFSKVDAFSARHGSVQMVRFAGLGSAQNVLLLGLGKSSELTHEKARLAASFLWSKLSAEKVQSASIVMEGAMTQPALIRGFLEGFLLNAYSFNKYKKSAEQTAGLSKLYLIGSDRALVARLSSEAERALAVAEAVNITRDWSNEPSNFGTPEYFAGEAVKLAKKYGIKCRVLSESDARREGMGLFLAVGQGSTREGKIVVLEYLPKGQKKSKNLKTIAFVGKGVTFDSGGISIKPSLRMEEMKHDMTGAATVFGATLLASKLKVSNRIVTILAFTENMPDGSAIQPGNIVRGRNGKTVEILNTDAEGRLILADALDYAHEFKPDVIVDAATLTGAVTVALGKQCCAILGNDDGLIEALREAGDENHERIWQLPLFDEYLDDLRSDSADLRNVANDGYGGTIRGAIFMREFIRKGMKWAHLDIAATANGMGHVPYFPKKGASGMYVRTLAQFASEF
ncbi:MAG: leucyl aminopeptidase [Bdellovibrionales bacterium]|nr:leucyl aminopeptidase [Bdellovibrionales bacterium]